MITVEADEILSPSPPARVDNRNAKLSEDELNVSTRTCLLAEGVYPSNLKNVKLLNSKNRSNRSNINLV